MSLALVSCVITLLGTTPVKLAAPGLTGANIRVEIGQFFSDHLNQQLTLRGLRVISGNEIATLLGIERQKQLLGCSDQASSCLIELANALGVEGVVMGSIGKFDDVYQLNLRILSAADAQPLAIHSAQVKGDKAVLDELTRASSILAPRVFTKLGREPPVESLSSPPPVSSPAATVRRNTGVRDTGTWIFLGGSAATVGGVVLAVASPPDSTANTVGGGLILLGLPGILLGGILYLVGGTEEVPVTAAIYGGPSGAGIGIRGSIP